MSKSTEFTSNSLAIVSKFLAALSDLGIPIHRRRRLLNQEPEWARRRLLQTENLKPDVTVAGDGTGDVRTVNEAVAMVPKKSLKRFVIYVKSGTYIENVVMDKSKWNVMIYGDGKGKTIISGGKNFIDGTPTYETATFGLSKMDQRRENIHQWLLKHKIKELEAYKGKNNSLLSLVIGRFGKLHPVSEELDVEYSNIVKMGGVDNESMLWAIKSARKILKKVKHVSTRGFNVFTGISFEEDGKQNKVSIQVQPFKPISTSTYHLGNHFDTNPLKKLLESIESFGIIVKDGRSVRFSSLRGTTQTLIHECKFPKYLPSQHITESAQLAEKYYFDASVKKPNVTGIILAGDKTFMRKMCEALITQLAKVVKNKVVVTYGGEGGFNYAIEKSFRHITGVRFCYEKVSLQHFFRELKLAEPKSFVGVDEMLNYIFELGAVKIVIVWEDFEANVCVMKRLGKHKLEVLNNESACSIEKFKNDGWQIVEEKILLLKWLADKHTLFGFDLDIVTNHTQEGYQFCIAFGGIGGILNTEVRDAKDGETSNDVEDGESYDDAEDGEVW